MKRIALIIGNNDYLGERKLNCAVNDAAALRETLKDLQFDALFYKNVSVQDLSMIMTEYSRKIANYEIGLFFFAGHGYQIEGKNYLGCTDTSFEDDYSMKHTGYPLQSILDDMQDSALLTKILIIDACRTCAGRRGGVYGFAPVFAPRGTLIAFATSPGQAAIERGDHGLFTSALLQHIISRNITIEEMFKRVRNTVYIQSSGKQVTWEHTSLLGDFYFNESIYSYSDIPYSAVALSDKNYEPVKHGKCFEMIEAARTHDYHFQNRIPSLLSRNKRLIEKEAPDDIFVLGRNLYQSAEDAYYISNFFDQLQRNMSSFQKEFANHLIAGMSFEIYFGSDGKLRKRFKTNKYYSNILSLLLDERYTSAKDFIVKQLQGYTQRVIYIPGQMIELLITLKVTQKRYTEEMILYIDKIQYDGLNIAYNEDGTAEYDYFEDDRAYESNIEELSELILRLTAGSKRYVQISYNQEDAVTVAFETPVYKPVNISLLKFSY